MNRKAVKTIAFIIIIALVVTSFTFILFLPGAYGADTEITAEEQKYLTEKGKELEAYLKWIHENYKDEVDYETLMNGAFEGAIYALGDPYSVYFVSNDEGEGFLQTATGEYEGAGVGLKINDNKQCEISSLAPGGPAEKAGLKIGDLIIKVDGQLLEGKKLEQMSALLRGKAGTKVTVVINRAGKEQSFTLTRDKIQTTSVYSEMLDGNIGYIRLTGFDNDGATEFAMARIALVNKGAKGLIIDVRNNPGGIVGTATRIADQFISTGDIMHIEQKEELLESVQAVNANEVNLPIVLLVNENSASAAEILAGALQDSGVATLVGTTTYGKGVAQAMETTKDGHYYKLSIYYFLTPDKHKINEVGITPDYVVPNTLGSYNEKAAGEYAKFAPFAETAKPKAGDTGLNVFAAQQRLAMLGYKVTATATMDEQTVLAVKGFQKEAGLYAYGTLDFTTMNRLDEKVQSYITGVSTDDLQLEKAMELLK